MPPPPKRPAGRRARDTEQWLARVDTWAIAQGLPAEHLAVVRQAVQMGHADYASIVAHLERWTDWREHDSYPAHPNPTHPTPKNARARGEQMNFDAEGW